MMPQHIVGNAEGAHQSTSAGEDVNLSISASHFANSIDGGAGKGRAFSMEWDGGLGQVTVVSGLDS